MGLETGGRRAVPTKDNEERSRLAIPAEKTRRTEGEREEDVLFEHHAANQKERNLKLSKGHSKTKEEKKPMMKHEDDERMEFTDNQIEILRMIREQFDPSTIRKNSTCHENAPTNHKEGLSRRIDPDEKRPDGKLGKEDEEEDKDEEIKFENRNGKSNVDERTKSLERTVTKRLEAKKEQHGAFIKLLREHVASINCTPKENDSATKKVKKSQN